MKLILASASPRRAEILRNAGISFESFPMEVDESPHPDESAPALVARLAEAKARAAAAQLPVQPGGAIVLGADTAVLLDGEILGKPRDLHDALGMFDKLSGREHSVLTGVFLIRLLDRKTRAAVETTRVRFARLGVSGINACVANGEPMDKAGAYAIQGTAGRYIPEIRGCYFNVVGLPLAKTYSLMRELGWNEP